MNNRSFITVLAFMILAGTTVSAQSESVRLRFECPVEARVLLDGKILGTVEPSKALEIATIPPGVHTFRIERRGQEPGERQVSLLAGMETTVFLGADSEAGQKPAILVLSSNEPGVAWTGTRQIATLGPGISVEVPFLAPGTHQIRFVNINEKVSLRSVIMTARHVSTMVFEGSAVPPQALEPRGAEQPFLGMKAPDFSAPDVFVHHLGINFNERTLMDTQKVTTYGLLYGFAGSKPDAYLGLGGHFYLAVGTTTNSLWMGYLDVIFGNVKSGLSIQPGFGAGSTLSGPMGFLYGPGLTLSLANLVIHGDWINALYFGQRDSESIPSLSLAWSFH